MEEKWKRKHREFVCRENEERKKLNRHISKDFIKNKMKKYKNK